MEAGNGRSRVQLCGRFVVEINGERIEDGLPGQRGRQLLAYLILNRARPIDRSRLIGALWGDSPPAGAETTVRGLIFRIRKVLGSDRLEGKARLRLQLPEDTWVDVEEARSGIHEAESAIALKRWKQAWLPARVAASIAGAGLLDGMDADWIHGEREALEEVRLRALECIAETGLQIGGPELGAAERAGRSLITAAPYRETGYLFLMGALERKDNVAEALRVYDRLRCLLRDELGIAPSARLQEAHERLLAAAGGSSG